MNDKSVKINFSWIWWVIGFIVISALGFIESGTLLGGAIAMVVCFLAYLSCFLGLIPVVGVFLHLFFVYPAITSTICGFQPTVHIPITLLVIAVISTIFSIVLTIIGGLLLLVFLAR